MTDDDEIYFSLFSTSNKPAGEDKGCNIENTKLG